ncbi:GAF domain-containing sensor histidine kinase [Aeromicrobium massiliense]|uniref:GAF domain-containing sensor histidine kinase n=1 Tax=Aeromicrobium massiliense TaxID=1464554 RepID=UPI0005787C42|nr:GAF domain-containing protein [Aeromicrobium massiliense]
MSGSLAGPRTPGVLDAAPDLAPDAPLEVVLRRVLVRACREVGARLALLVYVDEHVPGDARVVDHGLDDATRAALSDAADRAALLAADADLGPDSVAHAVHVGGVAYGRLHLRGKQTPGGPGFDEHDRRLAAVFADVLGPTIEHVRLHERARRQRAWAEAAADIAAVLVGPVSQASALQLVADRALAAVDADFVAVLLPRDDTSLAVEVVAGRDVPPALVGELTRPDGLPAEVVRTGAGLVVPDTDLEPLYLPGEEERWPQLRSVILLPLPGDEHVGVLALGWRERLAPGSWQLDPTLPQRFCDQAGLVVQVARARADRDRLAVLEDRDRIGRDLHDFVIQRLYGTALGLEVLGRRLEPGPVADQVSQAVDQLDETIQDIRRTIFELSTAEDEGVRTELLRLSDVVARSVGFRPRLVVDGPVDTLVVGPLRHQVLGVLGEAVSNAVRHAGASSIDVEVRASVHEGVLVRVTDDGRGLRGHAPRGGLLNMAHRAEGLGGSCAVRDRPDGGVEVLWQVPGEAVR